MPGFDMDSAVTSLGDDLGFDTSAGDNDDLELDNIVDSAVPGSGGDGNGVRSNTGAPVVPADGTPATPVDGAKPGDPAATGKPSADPAPGPGPAVDAPPKSWKPEVAVHWPNVQPEVKAEIQRREEDFFRGIEVYKADAGMGKAVKGLLEPYMPIMQQHGIDPMQQLNNLMGAHYTLATSNPQSKADLIKTLVREYQVDKSLLADLVQPASNPDDAPYLHPEVASLRDRINGLESERQQAQLRQANETAAAFNKDIESFASDAKNVYFKEVGFDMANLLKAGSATTLQDAYDKAVWANPVTRAKELARVNEEAAQKAVKEATDKAEAAHKASAANVKARAKSGTPTGTLGSMDDTMKATLRSIKEREGS